jgi:predicted membrane protein
MAAMRRLPLSLLLALSLLALALVLAPVADAHNDGRGFYGTTNDKVITNTGFILIAFFPLFVFTMSMLQRALDKRKEARKAARKAHAADARWRGGW